MLNELFMKYGCDKSLDFHQYVKEYTSFFEPIKNKNINILEIGIWKGTSLSAFYDYFPNANIYGIDIFTRVPVSEIPILKKDRVYWLKGDSMQSNICNLIKDKWGDIQFDIIIDDGLHTPLANKKTFENLIPFLKDTGVFYIEDIWPLDVMTDNEWNHQWIQKNRKDYTKENMNIFLDCIKDYKVAKFDYRSLSNRPDSVLYKIQK